jgi:hypothetical protein
VRIQSIHRERPDSTVDVNFCQKLRLSNNSQLQFLISAECFRLFDVIVYQMGAWGWIKKAFDKVKNAAKTVWGKVIKPIVGALAPAAGTAIGTYIGGPAGGAIGGTIGGAIGGALQGGGGDAESVVSGAVGGGVGGASTMALPAWLAKG